MVEYLHTAVIADCVEGYNYDIYIYRRALNEAERRVMIVEKQVRLLIDKGLTHTTNFYGSIEYESYNFNIQRKVPYTVPATCIWR